MSTDLSFYEKLAEKALNKAKTVEITNRCVSYLRVSSKEQMENESLSVQRKGCIEYARKNSLDLVEQFGNTYESAKTDERKEFNKMLAFVKNPKNKINIILVYSVDRFSRSGADSIYLLNELRKTGKKLIAVTQPIDTTSSSGKLHQNMMLLFSEFDNNQRREKTIAGIKEKLLKGEWPSKVATGYNQRHEDKVQIIEINAKGKLIQKAFMLKSEGWTNIEIQQKIKTLGLTLSKQKLTEIFKNSFYCGIMQHRVLDYKPVVGKHPQIISRAIFEKINGAPKLLRVAENKKEDELLPLKRHIKCDVCGTSWTGYEVKKKKKWYYKCNKKGCGCNASSTIIHQKYTEKLDEYKFNSTLIEPLQKQLKITFDYMNQQNSNVVKTLKTQLGDIEKKIDTIEERFVLGEISPELYNKHLEKFKIEKHAIEAEIEKCNLELSNLDNFINYAITMTGNLSKYWESSNTTRKQKIQNLMFPDGILYNKEKGIYRTEKVNGIISYIAELSKGLGEKKNGQTVEFNNLSALVAGARLELTTFGL